MARQERQMSRIQASWGQKKRLCRRQLYFYLLAYCRDSPQRHNAVAPAWSFPQESNYFRHVVRRVCYRTTLEKVIFLNEKEPKRPLSTLRRFNDHTYNRKFTESSLVSDACGLFVRTPGVDSPSNALLVLDVERPFDFLFLSRFPVLFARFSDSFGWHSFLFGESD